LDHAPVIPHITIRQKGLLNPDGSRLNSLD